MAGYDGHRGWINYLGVAPPWQRRGIVRRLMEAAGARLRAPGCPKINLLVRHTNEAAASFYERLGYRRDAVLSMGKRLDPGS
jgi:ribosomal protein S18 acetylase RimI-like enzyme